MSEQIRTKLNYANGNIHQVLNRIDGDIYVGSTCCKLSKRFYGHEQNIKSLKHKRLPLYVKLNDMGVENFYIELIELYPCSSKEELRAREGQYIREPGNLNQIIAGRTKERYPFDSKEKYVSANSNIASITMTTSSRKANNIALITKRKSKQTGVIIIGVTKNVFTQRYNAQYAIQLFVVLICQGIKNQRSVYAVIHVTTGMMVIAVIS